MAAVYRRDVYEWWEQDALVYSKREGVDLWRRLGDFVMLDDSLTQQREGSCRYTIPF